ncbi:TIGR01777 family oxidoreductase [Chryseosolibacter indicus]|uniref:TIGR01777 family oxidoreductase n=1 Tax=Chryseosolibacter indicus TaxID=2782351 RepID=A0ABS5VNN3_9BACT|nr:TIGR01777 family oxidoreductase [Chryseosolibacter indicus]MBT1703062.1 TIGR01777 family oxidoreductase [Chryseosolibacter indicus]
MHKIVVAGASGFLGTVLTDYFRNKCNIVLLSRSRLPSKVNVLWKYWDGETLGDWKNELEDADVLINLAGKSVNCRYTKENKQLIYNSRLNSTNILGEAILSCKQPPKLWINSSSTTIYEASHLSFRTEDSKEIGNNFSMDVCKQWEASFNKFTLPSTRKIIIRTSIVLGKSGGALNPLIKLVKLRLGGKQGDGEQYFSWVHEWDFCRAIEFLINNPSLKGTYNIAAPIPVINNVFMHTLRKSMKISVGLGAPKWLLEVGAVFIGTETELILKSRKVFPKRLLEAGFVFEFKDVKAALENLCR